MSGAGSESDARIYLLTREDVLSGALGEFAEKKEAVSRFLLAALLTSDGDVLNALRREIRKVTDILVPAETIADVLRSEVVKRETLEGDEAAAAARQVTRYAKGSAKNDAGATASTADARSATPAPAPSGGT